MAVTRKITLNDVLEEHSFNIKSSINKVRVGLIEVFNSSEERANITLVTQQVPINIQGERVLEKAKTVLIPDVPLARFKGYTEPINVGDYVLVLFTDNDIDDWLTSGIIKPPRSDFLHSKNNACFLPLGLKPVTDITGDYNNNSYQIKTEDGALITLDTKIEISNANQNLKNLLTSFANSLKDIKVLNPNTGQFDLPIDAGTIASIDDFVSNVNDLLK